MVAILPPPTSLAAQIGQGLGQGVQQYVGQQRLSSAFDQLKNLPQGSGLIEQLGAIAPTLLQVPGGSQLLGELAPLLQKQSLAQGYIRGLGGAQQPGMAQGGPPQGVSQLSQAMQQQPMAQRPLTTGIQQEQEQISPESTYPTKTVSEESIRPMTAEEINQRKSQLAQEYLASGALPDANQINQIIQQEQSNRMQLRQLQESERQVRETKQETISQDARKRFQESGMMKQPEDATIFEKLFQDKSRKERDPNMAYSKARDEYRKFSDAREGIKRQFDLAGPGKTLYRKIAGTYKDADDVIRDIQPQLNEFKKYGLYNEARDLLSGELGFGPEQVETALFYPSVEQRKIYSSAPENKNYPKFHPAAPPPRFAGSESLLKEDEYPKFKEEIGRMLNQDPNANLVVMRGVLNQDKHYAWQDISKAINELISDGSFQPNNQQSNQLNVIGMPPLPGLAAQFQYIWKGKK